MCVGCAVFNVKCGIKIKATPVVERCMGYESCDCLNLGYCLILSVLLAALVSGFLLWKICM